MSENGMLDCVLVVDLLVPSCWVGLWQALVCFSLTRMWYQHFGLVFDCLYCWGKHFSSLVHLIEDLFSFQWVFCDLWSQKCASLPLESTKIMGVWFGNRSSVWLCFMCIFILLKDWIVWFLIARHSCLLRFLVLEYGFHFVLIFNHCNILWLFLLWVSQWIGQPQLAWILTISSHDGFPVLITWNVK